MQRQLKISNETTEQLQEQIRQGIEIEDASLRSQLASLKLDEVRTADIYHLS